VSISGVLKNADRLTTPPAFRLMLQVSISTQFI
jgi:hypothetical protein